MRRIMIWVAATVIAVALLTGYQLAFAGTGAKSNGDGTVHEGKPGERK